VKQVIIEWMSSTDDVVQFAAEIAKWLLILSSATGVGIRFFEWWQRQTKD